MFDLTGNQRLLKHHPINKALACLTRPVKSLLLLGKGLKIKAPVAPPPAKSKLLERSPSKARKAKLAASIIDVM